MLKNNNQPAIQRLYKRMLTQNKMRNVIAIIAIALTTFMFTTIFTMGYSVVGNISDMLLKGQGGKDAMFLDYPSESQIEEAKACSTVDAAGIRIKVTKAEKPGDENIVYNLFYYDEVEFEKNLKPALGSIYGNYPVKSDEIMFPKKSLGELDNPEPNIGDTVKLSIDGEIKQFILSGYYIGFSKKNPILVSEGYASEMGCTLNNAGMLCVSAKHGDVDATLTQLEENVTLRENQDWDHNFDVQSENSSSKKAMIIMMCLMSLLIVISGYLLIYNIMYMSVAKDIRFYGMLKTIGTSVSQINKLVKLQAKYLATIGIPIGMLIGTAASFGLVPIAMKMFEGGRAELCDERVFFNPGIYLFAIGFSIATVYISSNKPAKLASQVTPVDALRYNEVAGNQTRNFKASKSNKIFSMAYRNVFRDKKRSRLVFASLFFGCMIFLCVNTFISSLDADSFLKSYFHHDYVLYIDDVTDPYSDNEDINERLGAAEELVEAVSEIDNLTYFRVNRSAMCVLPFDEELYHPFLENSSSENYTMDDMIEFYKTNTDSEVQYGAVIISLDRKNLEIYNEEATQKIDIDAFERGEQCIIGKVESRKQADELLGKTITIENGNSQAKRNIEIGSVMNRFEDGSLPISYGWVLMGAPDVILVSDKVMEEIFPEACINAIVADANQRYEAEIVTELQNIMKNSDCISGSDLKSVEGADFKKSMLSLTIVGDGISFILILIGLINFINVFLTSVITRSRELAILESAGMTKKQIRNMLVSEGRIYGVITTGLVLTIGTVMILGVGKFSKYIADYAVMKYPYFSVTILIVLIMAVCEIVPGIIFRDITKQTVSERIRQGAE